MTMQNRWLAPVIAALALNASVINLTYFVESENTLAVQVLLGLVAFAMLFRIRIYSAPIFIGLAIGLLAIIIYNFSQPLSLFVNPCIPILGLMAFLAGTRLYSRHDQTLIWTVIVFVIIQLGLQLYFNFNFSPAETITNRSKGFGSGTTYSTLAAFLLIYFTSKLEKSRSHPLLLLILSAIPIWSILLTQSRGAFVSLLIIFFTNNLRRRGASGTFLLVVTLVAVFVAMNPFVLESVPLLDRLRIDDNFDIQAYSSGRAETQVTIINWLTSESNVLALLFGAEGLNGIKALSYQGFQFPHFDILYLVYDTGLVGAGLYLAFAFLLLIRTRFDSYILLYFISGLHTNMILAPAFLLLSMVLYQAKQVNMQFDRPRNVQLQPAPRQSLMGFDTK
jgi:hypothetical protein